MKITEDSDARRERMIAALDELRKAERVLIDAAKREYPVGTLIQVHKGRGVILARVEAHSEYGYRPGRIIVRNVRTQKTRKVNLAYDDVRVVEATESEVAA